MAKITKEQIEEKRAEIKKRLEENKTLLKSLIEEEKNLYFKIADLWNFVISSKDWEAISDVERSNFDEQHSAMIEYNRCLLDRICIYISRSRFIMEESKLF